MIVSVMDVDRGSAVGLQMSESNHVTWPHAKSASKIVTNYRVIGWRLNSFSIILGPNTLHRVAIVTLNNEDLPTIGKESTTLYFNRYG